MTSIMESIFGKMPAQANPKPPQSPLVRINCTECGQQFGVQPNLAELRKQDGGTVYCPNGHTLRLLPAKGRK
jgi:hypothetical protein